LKLDKIKYPEGLKERELKFCQIIARFPAKSYSAAATEAGYVLGGKTLDIILGNPLVTRFVADIRGKELKDIDTTSKGLLKMAKGCEGKAMRRYLDNHPLYDEKNALIAAKSVKDSLSKQGTTLYEAAEAEDKTEEAIEIAQRMMGETSDTTYSKKPKGIPTVGGSNTPH
jgi:hypothetical protein